MQVAATLRKALVCLMKQKGQTLTIKLLEGRICPSNVAKGSSSISGM